MNTFRPLTLVACIFLSATLFSQPQNAIKALDFKLELMSDNQTWGVFVIPGKQITPSTKTNTGTGQVTLVAPVGFSYSNLRNHGGTWIENARVNGPMEAPGKSYISFGFVTEEPKIMFYPNESTLLFTFTTSEVNCEIFLIDNINDPFATPNSYGSNPGNDLGVLDFGNPGGMLTYGYNDNVTPGNGGSALAKGRDQAGKAILTNEKGTDVPAKKSAAKISE